MDSQPPVERSRETDHGRDPFVVNIPHAARQNRNFRTALWTGHHLQMTLMCIPVCGEIGVEMHPNTDQFIRVEGGVFVPCGAWHNILNTRNCPLTLSSIYAPPQHPKGTIHCAKVDAENEEY